MESFPSRENIEEALGRALGTELRRHRDDLGWSRDKVVGAMPSGVTRATLKNCEMGSRRMTVVRLVEICAILGVEPATVINDALQRSRLFVHNLTLRVNLRAMLSDPDPDFSAMLRQWAENRLSREPVESRGIVQLSQNGIAELADAMNVGRNTLLDYLLRYTPS